MRGEVPLIRKTAQGSGGLDIIQSNKVFLLLRKRPCRRDHVRKSNKKKMGLLTANIWHGNPCQRERHSRFHCWERSRETRQIGREGRHCSEISRPQWQIMFL